MNAPSRREIVLRLLKEIAPDTEPERLSSDEDYRAALGIDSFDTLRFLVALAERIGVEIPERDYGRIGTLEGLLTYLEQARPSV